MDKEDRKNAEGYNDPTAYYAIRNVERDSSADDERFHIEERVVIKDKKTGKVWR